jgi:hypothetical protein
VRRLGSRYECGDGVEKDAAKAVKLYARAAEVMWLLCAILDINCSTGDEVET